MNKLWYVLALSMIVTPVSSWGHGEDDEVFDPVSNDFGSYEPGLKADRIVEISMSDAMRFAPSEIEVKQNEVITFKITNAGELKHEFVLGTDKELAEHAEMMKKFPNMEHSEPYMAHVEPGAHGEVTWQFTQTGTVSFACLIPGHFDAGMKGSVTVE